MYDIPAHLHQTGELLSAHMESVLGLLRESVPLEDKSMLTRLRRRVRFDRRA